MEEEFSAALAFLNGLQQSDNFETTGYDGRYLSLLESDAWADPSQFLETLDDNESAAQAPQKRGKKRRKNKGFNPNKAREELRAEVSILKNEVEELEFIRKGLQAIRNKRQASTNAVNSSHGVDGTSLWRETCTRQLKRRLNAERENIGLRKNCEKALRVVSSVKNLLNSRPALWDINPETRIRTRRIEIPNGYVNDMVTRIFDDLSAGVEASYLNVKQVTEANPSGLSDSATHVSIFTDGVKGRSREIFNCSTLPFGVIEISDAWWEDWHTYSGRSVQNTADVVAESFGLEICDVAVRISATFYAQQVLRRFVEDNRVVIVWNAYIEPIAYKGKRVRGAFYIEKSNVIIKPKDLEQNGILTQISSQEVITPHILDSKLKNDPKIAALTSVLVNSMAPYYTARIQTIETMLLDRVIQVKRGG
ncbi:hypothetical protein JG687_00001108 [Phytophthora cactorum]|uniref:Uncharacterized protein n=1 Tax=Phytophthora cactorum TaxID=29920 RepID=A0A329SR65_9STRA|nr:hypothetical protein Pcac1_g6392 [Phytophthora cactorum]KAG2829812.1 hypothetical protein PC112_g7948 [Phytophthora cactorum]KAG2831897.1 hypothetical protein PC111_g6822 [Phytophthora cactorum]KAG2860221.1 hypothetical protein PC113_g8240 [Phytophthora cactorum]KAG2913824.1 hypothetical protein PC114_g8423 [Phytophthora cactorum]